MALDHPSGHFAVRILGSGLARTLPDSGNYCPSIPGTTCCWPVLGGKLRSAKWVRTRTRLQCFDAESYFPEK